MGGASLIAESKESPAVFHFVTSRKSSIAKMSGGEDADHRLAGSLVLAMKGVEQGCQLLRVHDVAETRQALSVAMALGGAD